MREAGEKLIERALSDSLRLGCDTKEQEALPPHLCDIVPPQVAAYGGKLRYTLSYTSGPQGSPLSDPDIQITVSSLESTVGRQKRKWKPCSQHPASQCGLSLPLPGWLIPRS